MSKRYFISHASADKPTALDLKAALGNDAWVDLHEIGVGDILLESISSGIEGASDFILLWSASSARSNWVQFELHMAFIRWIEDQAVAIRIVKIDDSPVPLHMRPFLQSREARTGTEIASVLASAGPPAAPRRKFFNRNNEIALVEDSLYDRNLSALYLCGLPGVGKRTLAKEALNRITSGVGTVREIQVSSGTAEPELNLLLAAALGVDPCSQYAAIPEVVAHSQQLLASFNSSGGVWVFQDAEHWLVEDGSLSRIAVQVLSAVQSSLGKTDSIVIFTSRRKPNVSAEFDKFVKTVYLNGLSARHSIPLLRSQGAQGEDWQLREVAEELDGHPLALEVVASSLPMDMSALMAQRHSIASDLIDPSRTSPLAWRLLEALALVDSPMSGEDLTDFLQVAVDEFQQAVTEVIDFSLATHNSYGAIVLHPIFRDYFVRSYRKQPDHLTRWRVPSERSHLVLESCCP